MEYGKFSRITISPHISISISIYFSKKCLNNYNTSTINKNKKKTA
jgi:hypothetical protein